MASYPTIRELRKALGEAYSIYDIDNERCLYRDFGNGFNVEISGVSRANQKGPATIYLWFGDCQPECIIVKTVHDIGRNAPAIKAAVEELFDLSQSLVRHGYCDWPSLFKLKHNL